MIMIWCSSTLAKSTASCGFSSGCGSPPGAVIDPTVETSWNGEVISFHRPSHICDAMFFVRSHAALYALFPPSAIYLFSPADWSASNCFIPASRWLSNHAVPLSLVSSRSLDCSRMLCSARIVISFDAAISIPSVSEKVMRTRFPPSPSISLRLAVISIPSGFCRIMQLSDVSTFSSGFPKSGLSVLTWRLPMHTMAPSVS